MYKLSSHGIHGIKAELKWVVLYSASANSYPTVGDMVSIGMTESKPITSAKIIAKPQGLSTSYAYGSYGFGDDIPGAYISQHYSPNIHHRSGFCCKKSCRYRCFNNLKCSTYCHTKVSTYHNYGTYLPVLSERTQIGLLEDIPIDPELLARVAGPASGGQQSRYCQHRNPS